LFNKQDEILLEEEQYSLKNKTFSEAKLMVGNIYSNSVGVGVGKKGLRSKGRKR
jgi:hypothetical protein